MAGFRAVRVEETSDETPLSTPPRPLPPAEPSRVTSIMQDAAARSLLLGIAQLNKRAVVAASHLFTLLLCGSAFVLWWEVLPNPSAPQLTGLGLYGVFVLLTEIVRRRWG